MQLSSKQLDVLSRSALTSEVCIVLGKYFPKVQHLRIASIFKQVDHGQRANTLTSKHERLVRNQG